MIRIIFIIFLVILWVSTEEDLQQKELLRKTIDHLKLEADDLANKTYRVNDTYLLPSAIATSVTELFSQNGNDPKLHYYHNLTGTFRGHWSINLETAALVDKEQPLPEAPQPPPSTPGGDKDKEQDGSQNPKDPTRPVGGGNNSTSPTDDNGQTDDSENSDHGMVDAIVSTKPAHQGDVAAYRGKLFNYTNPGQLLVNFKEHKISEAINWVEGSWRLKHDNAGDSGISLMVQGLHYIHNGTLYMWGIPEDAHMPLIHVLELMPDEASFVTAKEAIKERYVSRIQTLQNIVDGREEFETYEPLASEEAGCNYQIYMQLGAIDSSIKPSHLKELEKEWASPQGISTIRAPPLNASMIMYSPNCRLVMQAKEMKGMKIEKVYSKMLHYAVMAGIIAFIQVILLSKQMEFTLTPTSVSKVSYWTITIHSIMDANLFMVYYSTGATYDRLFLPFAAAAFFSCVLVSIFGMRYMYVIRRIQRPERRERRAASANSGSNTTTNTNGANSDGLPLPATARRPNSPSEGNQSRLDIQGFLQDNYLLMLFLVLILFQIASMFAILQTILFDVIMVVMYSFWVPQISRNAIRGSSKALTPWFVLGMSVTRLYMPLYFYACPDNFMGTEPSKWVWVVVGWVCFQTVLLLMQDWLGPRFFIPAKYLPPIYDYHPILPAHDEENDGEGAHGGRHAQDCAICMLPIDTSQASQSSGGLTRVVGSHLGRLNYMLTPCGHLFHTECLEKWMRIKLECPNCRTFLPSI